MLLGGAADSDGGDGTTRGIVPRHRAWHLVARTGDELAPTARLFLTHLTTAGAGRIDDRFRLVPTA